MGFESQIEHTTWKLIAPQIEANIKRRLNGKLGGAPKGNRNAQKNNQKQPKNNQKQPNVNVNVNVNDNDIIAADGSATAAHSNKTKFVKPSLHQIEEYCKTASIQGLLKIKVTNKACLAYKEDEK